MTNALAFDPGAVVTPIRPKRTASDLADHLILAVAAADDVVSAISQAVAMLRRAGGAERVEWWRPTGDGSAMRLETADGTGRGRRKAFPLGPPGVLVVVGEWAVHELDSALPRLVPVMRRRWTDEQLADYAGLLARRVEALEDFAALVAHDLKAPLHAALSGGDPQAGIEQALGLVDSLLELAHAEAATELTASVADCLDDALQDLDATVASLVVEAPHWIPIPPCALRVLLRNLVANALAGHARRICVRSAASGSQWAVTVDDDGVGLDARGGYAQGSGLGLRLCRRLAARLGSELELEPRLPRGTRAVLASIGGGP